jgi:hypothetical protein
MDLDGDGRQDWVIGADQEMAGPGYARVLSAGSGNEIFTLHGDVVGDEFGASVSGAGIPGPSNTPGSASLNNLVPGLAVGARRYSGPAGSQTGAARLYYAACPGIVSYCTAGTSASGCQAVLGVFGTAPSASSASNFYVYAGNVEGAKDGLFFFGWNGRKAAQWGNGTSYQCVVPPVKRGGVIPKRGGHGTCTGYFQQDLNQLWFSTPAKNPGAGAVVQVQLWYRDPNSTSNQTTSFSDALELVVCP